LPFAEPSVADFRQGDRPLGPWHLVGGRGLRRGAAYFPRARAFCRHRRFEGVEDLALGGEPMLFGFAVAAAGGKPDFVGAFADAVVKTSVHADSTFMCVRTAF
jgi:hypothetical protein